MDDDFNTPGAIAALQSAARALNVAKTAGHHDMARGLAAEIRQLGGLLGLLGRAPDEWLETRSALSAGEESGEGTLGTEAIEERIAARIEARRRKDWAESDRIRDELAAAGILLEDGAGGTTWRRK